MIRDYLKEVAAPIYNNEQLIGSSVVWVPKCNSNILYLYTAAHVLIDECYKLKDNLKVKLGFINADHYESIASDNVSFHEKFKHSSLDCRVEFDVAVIRLELSSPVLNVSSKLRFGSNIFEGELIGRGFPNDVSSKDFYLLGQELESKVKNKRSEIEERFQIEITTNINTTDRDHELSGYSGTGIFSKISMDDEVILYGILSHGEGENAKFSTINCYSSNLIISICVTCSWDYPEMCTKEKMLSKCEATNKPDAKLVLFNNYSSACEPFYLEREIDKKFMKALEMGNVWIHGKSGSGKTTIVNRNLSNNHRDYCFCDLSPITIKQADDVLMEMLIAIEDKLEIKSEKKEGNILKRISEIVCNQEQPTIIVIDEMSVSDTQVLSDIYNKFVQLAAYVSNSSSNNKLILIISTIINPLTVLMNKSKAVDYFSFMLNIWSSYEIGQLLLDICDALSIDLNGLHNEIIASTDLSPRLLKAIVKKLLVNGDNSKTGILEAIKETLEEAI